MSVSRRSLLWNSILAGLAWIASPLLGWSGNKPNSGKNSAQSNVSNAGWQHLTRAAFTKAVGSGFQVSSTSGKGGTVWLRLLAVEDLPPLVPPNLGAMAVQPPKSTVITTKGFMLSFLGTLPKPLAQGTYTFQHPGLGKFDMLIVPGGSGAQTYTAVINQLP